MSQADGEAPGDSSGPLRLLFAGHVLLALATLALLARAEDGSSLLAGWDSGLCVVAALLVFVALYRLGLARKADYPVRLAGALWSGELGMRIAVLLLPDGQLPLGEARVLRLFLAGGAGLCLAWSYGRSLPTGRLQSLWVSVRWAFTLQLALIFTLELIALTTSRSVVEIVGRLPEGAATPLAWTAFALPYTAQLFALHRTLRE
ncbi:MAG: hypothetical protein H6831_09115 [Planctomycetes bacterium]|nr:hypothetical protein [Planctomycetota bacterium]